MKKIGLCMAAVCLSMMLAACGTSKDATTQAMTVADDTAQSAQSDKVASADEMVTPEDVVEDGMTPVTGDKLQDGTYDIEVKSSSSMFKITACSLTVTDGKMSAVMTMGGTGYQYVYMGTGEQAATAAESDYIPYVEDASGAHTFTVPVSALDDGIHCAAFSRKKQKWYDRVLLFRADSLPKDAWKEDSITKLTLEEGQYTVDVQLKGGSGRATVTSPASLTVTADGMTATIEWSSSNYDYMVVNGEKYLPVNTDGNAVFEIPVDGFDYDMPVSADTTAMSTPHEIEYTLHFDSASVKAK